MGGKVSNYIMVPMREGGGFIYVLIFGNMLTLKLVVSRIYSRKTCFNSWSLRVLTNILFHFMYI